MLRRKNQSGRFPHLPQSRSESLRPGAVCDALERRTLFDTTVFTIDPTASRVSLAGEALDVELQRQADASLIARYEGVMVTDVVMSASPTIRFLGGGSAAAEMRGTFDPGAAPANYAGKGTQFGVQIAEMAVRDLRLDVVSQLITVAPNGTFPSTATNVNVLDGQFSYDVSGIGGGSFVLGGQGVANRTTAASTLLIAPDGSLRLTIPVDVTYTYGDPGATLRLRGQIVGVAGADRGLRPRVDANGAEFGSGNRAVFTTVADAPPVVIPDATGLTIFDHDSATLSGATVVLESNPDGADELLDVDRTGTPIQKDYDPVTGTLTLTGNGSVAQYQQVLRTLTYDNNAAEHTFGERSVRITLSDEVGAGPASVNTVSVEEPFNVNTGRIGLNSGPQGGRIVTFTEPDGTFTTITLAGGGGAYVRFEGAQSQLLQNGVVSIAGANLRLLRIDAYGTTALSRLNIRAVGGDGQLNLPALRVTGPLNTVGGRGVNLTGDMDVNGRINKATFNNVTNADVTADSILKMTLTGTMQDSTVTLADPFTPLVPVLGNLSVRGNINGSTIQSVGNMGGIKAAAMVNSVLRAGVIGTDRFPSVAGDFANEAGILKVTLKAPLGTASFDNSVIAANNLGRLALGLVDTDNAGVPFGVAGDTIAALGALNSSGQRLRLALLDDPAVYAAMLPQLPFTFGDFQIRLV